MSDVIRSFLVSVGVQTDENGMRRFSDAVAGVTKTVTALGAAVGAMAAATATAVVKVSDQFDELYYASQRLRASVVNIKAFDYGVSQMGGTAAGARASLEGLAEFLRSNPGGEGFLASMGIRTRDGMGNLRDTTDMMRDIGDQFRQMPYFLAKIRAGMLGIDETTLQALIRGTDLWSDRYREMAQGMGVDFDVAAEASARFMQNLRDLRAQIEIGLISSLLKLQEKIGPGLERAAQIGMAIISGFSRLIGRLIDGLADLDEKTDGWATTLIVVTTLVGILAATVGPAVVLVAALAGAIGLLIDDFLTWREGGESFLNWEGWSDEIDAAISAIGNLGTALSELWDVFSPIASAIIDVVGPAFEWLAKTVIADLSLRVYRLAEQIRSLAALMRGDLKAAAVHAYNSQYGFPAAGASANARASAIEANDNAPVPAPSGSAASRASEALNYFMRMGWTREQAAGLVANLQAESAFNPSAVGDGGKAFGIAQWHPDRQAEFKRAFGKDIRDATFQEQLAFVHWELTRGNEQRAGRLLRNARSANEAGRSVSQNYERPKDAAGEMARRGQLASQIAAGTKLGTETRAQTVNVNNKTEIKVEGATQPRETARQVETAADRAYAKMVRNTRNAVR